MTTNTLLYPLFALAAWTACVQLLIPISRIRAAVAGKVTTDDFALGESGRVPPEASIPNRNYMNLLEFPVLFYVGTLIACVAAEPTPLMARLGWAYVAARVLHSVIHLTYNNVAHRGLMFGVSNVILVALWVVVALHLRGAS